MSNIDLRAMKRWESVERLAARLGVSPLERDEVADIAIHSGLPPHDRRYDLIAMINALLDEMDAVAMGESTDQRRGDT